LKHMHAWTCTTPGTLERRDIPEPIQEPGRTILTIRRIGVCGTDLHAFEGTQPYFSYPRILGHELAGEGPDGRLYTITPYYACGHCIACRNGRPNCCVSIQVCGVHIDGGMVERLSVPDKALIPGEGLPADTLALVEPLAIGAHGVRRAAIREQEWVLIVGAGPIGLGTAALAQFAGANVIVLDKNEARLAFCRSALGVAHTITTGEALADLTHGDMPTVVIDATGSLKAIEKGLDYLAHGGRYVLIGLQKEAFHFAHPEFHKRETTLMSSRNATRDDFRYVMDALREKKIDPVPFITHRVGFDAVGAQFPGWLDPASGVIKAMIEL
jgi:2-desacetyl-2-hydroxyethyl bacteriochlorophyllide A dehydrogenase